MAHSEIHKWSRASWSRLYNLIKHIFLPTQTKLSLPIKLFADFAEEKDWMSFINTKYDTMGNLCNIWVYIAMNTITNTKLLHTIITCLTKGFLCV